MRPIDDDIHQVITVYGCPRTAIVADLGCTKQLYLLSSQVLFRRI